MYLWLLYYTAQHYLFIDQYEESLKFLKEAIEHTPTVVELYELKAKVMKHAGNNA